MSRAPTVCLEPGCGNLVPAGRVNRCAKHKHLTPRSPSSHVTGTQAWKLLRQQVLARDRWTCTRCPKPATQVHHLEPIGRGGRGLPPLHLLTSLCDDCHQSMHREGVGDPLKPLGVHAARGVAPIIRIAQSSGFSGRGRGRG
jgi:5-methylcytosine-specific restriction endonuclease McrA